MPRENEAKVHGHCDPAFRAVREALEENLADPDESGESVSVVVDGKTVVDLWGGYRDVARSKPWNHETIVGVLSAGKPIGALAVPHADRARVNRSGGAGHELLAGVRPGG
jgi:CubicO group peptidase (beta-lactamase class C family)